MGCIFACFRFKDDDRRKAQMFSKSVSNKKDPSVSKSQLSSVFICEEHGSPCEKVGQLNPKDINDDELKREAKFLKSCGALLETPAEIRKASQNIDAQTHDRDNSSSNAHLWLPSAACKKLLWDEPLDHAPSSQKQEHEDPQSTGTISGSSNSEHHQKLAPQDGILHASQKSVNFEHEEQVPGVKSNLGSSVMGISPYHNDSQIKPPASKPSPYPTPLKLTDEMQTPGTVYPANRDKFGTGKNVRIRTQYVFPVLNPVENSSQWKVLGEGSDPLFRSSEVAKQQRLVCSDDRQNKQHILLTPHKENQESEKVYEEQHGACCSPSSVIPSLSNREEELPERDGHQIVVSSLSQWLKPPPANGARRCKVEHATKENTRSVNSPVGDRPILGSVAAHWNGDDEPSHISPKWWDGNGIPNSTTKYKEDQRVSWHATPFEERLEKALSDENHCPQRKATGGKIMEFDDEGEEHDTAASYRMGLQAM